MAHTHDNQVSVPDKRETAAQRSQTAGTLTPPSPLQRAINDSARVATQRAWVTAIDRSPRNVAKRAHCDQLIGNAGRRIADTCEQGGGGGTAQAGAQLDTCQTAYTAPTTQRVSEAESGSAGLPDPLKSGVEALSGMSMTHVNVHYNSAQPAQLGALAYAQGSDIHLGPGQEGHLAHEAWHVVQQAQGRVRPTMEIGDVAINDDHGLESEADRMGARATSSPAMSQSLRPGVQRLRQPAAAAQRVQVPVPPEVRIAFLNAREMVLVALLRLLRSARDPGIVRLVHQYFGHRATVDEAIDMLEAIRKQLADVQDEERVQCYDATGVDPFATHREASAMNIGTGINAQMLVCLPRFLRQRSRDQSETLIHEASHGLSIGETRDVAYAHERLFKFLPQLNLALENADSVAAFTGHAASKRAGHDRVPTDLVYRSDGGRPDKAETAKASEALGMVGLGARAARGNFRDVVQYLNACEPQNAYLQHGHDHARLLLHNALFKANILAQDLTIRGYRTVFQLLADFCDVLQRAAAFGSIGFVIEPLQDNPRVDWFEQRAIRVGDCTQMQASSLAVTLLLQAFRLFDGVDLLPFAPLISAAMLNELFGDDSSSSSSDSDNDGHISSSNSDGSSESDEEDGETLVPIGPQMRPADTGNQSTTQLMRRADQREAPIQARFQMLETFRGLQINRHGWQAFVIAIDDGDAHVTVFTDQNLSTAQWQALNKAAKQERVVAVQDLPNADTLHFDEFHVTVGGDKHHFYTDDGNVNLYPAHGQNEPLRAASWLRANELAVRFFAHLGLQVSLFTLDSRVNVAQQRAEGKPDELDTLKFWGIK